jgi:hypothetical protein
MPGAIASAILTRYETRSRRVGRAVRGAMAVREPGSIDPPQEEDPMTVSMYDASVPSLKHMLGSLASILGKAAEYAAERKIDAGVLIQARLFPDMLPLVKQIQIASDQAKGGVGRLAAVEITSFADDEASFDELQTRIAKTIAFLDSISAQQLDDSAQRDIVLTMHEKTFEFKGQDYLLNWVLPNFYFHVTTAYAILRHNGVVLGKKDFLGG